MYPNYALLQRSIVASNNLVKQDVDCSKENEKSKKQDSKYLQPRWCPSDLSHTQKRRLQCMCKKEAMEQQVEAVPKTSATMKMVWRPRQIVSTSTWLEQVIADNYLSPLAQKIADVTLIIAPRQFWLRRIFFDKLALPKNRRAYVDSQNWHQPVWPIWMSGLTGRSTVACPAGTDRSDRSRRSPSQLKIFVDLDL